LPQLFNVVITGDLSLVGPRHMRCTPERRITFTTTWSTAISRATASSRHNRLGAGQWLARRNRYAEKIQKRVEYDLDYIENWSLLRDIYILALTPFALVRDITLIDRRSASVPRANDGEPIAPRTRPHPADRRPARRAGVTLAAWRRMPTQAPIWRPRASF